MTKEIDNEFIDRIAALADVKITADQKHHGDPVEHRVLSAHARFVIEALTEEGHLKKEFSDNEIHQVDLALRLAGFAFKKQHVELIMRILNETDGSSKLDEIVKIRHEVEQKYEDIETAKAMDL